MDLRALVLALVAAFALVGCKRGETKAEFVDVAGTYAGENKVGPAATLVLSDDGTFTILDNEHNGKGKYTRKGDVLTLVIDELNGKEVDFNLHNKPMKLAISADRTKLDGEPNLHFRKK